LTIQDKSEHSKNLMHFKYFQTSAILGRTPQ